MKDTADNYKLDYATDADYEAYLKLCEESSNYKVEDVELTAQSQIVSLSTCRLMTKKGNYMADRFDIGDIITMKKPHPCGSKEWEVLRVGADFRLKCVGCGHQIMVARKLVEKNTRQIVKRT